MKKVLSFIVFGIAVLGAVMGILYLLDDHTATKSTETNDDAVFVNHEPNEGTVDKPDRIDFQPVIDAWLNQISGNKSIVIYDLDRDEIVGKYNSDESYETASLYKLFVVYEGYKKVQSGEWKGDDQAGSTGYNILKCLDLSIRESYSPCAETLLTMIGRENLEKIIRDDYGITNTDIAHLISTPNDIMKMMKIYYEHSDIKDQNLIDQMKDSFLNQPPTTYNWRQGLPSGFTKAKVYDKVGWEFIPDGGYWRLYHDAAIVDFSDKNRHFIVVVMTNRVPFERILEFGSALEKAFYGE